MGPEVILYQLLFTPQGQALLKSSASLAGKVAQEISDLIGTSSNPKTPDLDLDGGWPIVIHVDPEPKGQGSASLDDLFGIPGSGFDPSKQTDPVKNDLARGICIGDIANKYGSKVAKELGISFSDLAYGGFFVQGSGGGAFGTDKLFRARCPENTIFMGFDCDGNPRCISILLLTYQKVNLIYDAVKPKDPTPPEEPPPEEPKTPPVTTSGTTRDFKDCFTKWFYHFKRLGMTNAQAQIKAHHFCVPTISGDPLPLPPEPQQTKPKAPPVTTSRSLNAFWLRCYNNWMAYLQSIGIPFNLAHGMAIDICKTAITEGRFKTAPQPVKKEESSGLFADLEQKRSSSDSRNSLSDTSRKIENMTKEIFLNMVHPKKY